MSTNNYGEIFCQATEILAQNLMSKISYDQTILCTIIDDSEKDFGKYRVSNGEAAFDAYTSDTSLKKNNQVYVSIPGGNWDEQKIIVSKKITNLNEPMTYKDPFDSFVNITNNIITTGIGSKGLTANDADLTHIALWSYNSPNSGALIKDSGETLCGYTYLAMSADFRAWLRSYNIVKGNYGLQLVIKVEPEDDSQATPENKYCILSTNDMTGNPFNFDSYYNQKKLFNIADLNNIKSMVLYFYQENGSFKDKDGSVIDYDIKPPANIFVKDPIISLGCGTNEFNEDTLIIYSLDSQKYSSQTTPLSNNHKKLQARWIHKFDDGKIETIQLDDEINYELNWYYQRLGSKSHTVWSGVDWAHLSTQKRANKNTTYEIKDAYWIDYNNNSSSLGSTPIRSLAYNQSWLFPDITLAEEKVKAVLTFGDKVLYSNILTFSNENEVIDQTTVDALAALSINCEDKSYGNYLIYDLGGKILDDAESKKVRNFKAYFNYNTEDLENSSSQLTEANTIEWIIPTQNTMINIEDYISGNVEQNYVDSNGYQHIFRYGANISSSNSSVSNDADITNQNSQRYRIDNQYDNSKSNNTIKCIVTKNGIKYTAVKELTFGPAGTSGTNYTFVIDFISNDSVLTIGDNSKSVIARARLYDYTGKEVPNLETKDIVWSVLNNKGENDTDDKNSFIKLVDVKNKNPDGTEYIAKNKKELQLLLAANAKVPENNFTILKATLKKSSGNNNGWGDFDLEAYLPVPIRKSKQYPYISGTTTIFYNSLGELDKFYQNPYILYYKENDEADVTTTDSTWEIFSDEENDNYIPKMSSGNDGYKLIPIHFYVEDSMKNLCVVGYKDNEAVWSQPIYVTQNKYPSSIINDWNGELTIDNKNNAILAAKIAAGKKNSDNTFTGVIMGDWSGNDTSSAEGAITKNTGIYGFKEGVASFGFRDDGTAFIGKPGAGRLDFDGDKSIIQSNSMAEGLGGMKLDFDDGLIKLLKPSKQYKKTLSASQWSNNSQTVTINGLEKNGLISMKLNSTATDAQKQEYNNANFSISATEDNTARITYSGSDPTKNIPIIISVSDYEITIDAKADETPFKIGKKFKVKWDGSLTASDGDFTGTINSEQGFIGGWEIGTDTLKGGSITLNSYEGSISGGKLIANDGEMDLIGAFQVCATDGTQIGKLGYGIGHLDEGEIPALSLSSNGVQLLVSQKHIALDSGSGYLALKGNTLTYGWDSIGSLLQFNYYNTNGDVSPSNGKAGIKLDIEPDYQFGIYARFA